MNSNYEIETIEMDLGNTEGIQEVETLELPDPLEANAEALTEVTEIDYDAILTGLEQDAINQGFEHIDIHNDSERLNQSLESFIDTNWETMSLDDKKAAMDDLANYVRDSIDFKSQPAIEYYNNAVDGDYGGYDPMSNTLHVNEHMLHDSNEAADTIAHELWHAYQYERSNNPQNSRDFQYQYNFDNYISADLGQEAYENQLVEAEARGFASQFKDQIYQIKGGQNRG